MFSKEADVFFWSPRKPISSPSWFGVLYLLRRDIDLCMGVDPNTGNKIPFRALWPAAMTMLAGIDLLAKFSTGSDAIARSGDRFKTFVDQYFTLTSANDREVIYQLRNSLLHSFGLYSKDSKGNVYNFTLTGSGTGTLVSTTAPDKVFVDLMLLHQAFEVAVTNYSVALNGDPQLQTHFNAMYQNYGRVYIA